MFEDDIEMDDETWATEHAAFMEKARQRAEYLRSKNIHKDIGLRFSGPGQLKQTQLNNTRIAIIGAGSIGGRTAEILARMGFTDLTVYDFDDVEVHNVGTQPYGLIMDLNLSKTTALQNRILLDCGFEINVVHEKVTSMYGTDYDFTILATDSIDSRKEIVKQMDYPNIALIDARMSMGTWNCLILPYASNNHAEYKAEYLFSKEEAVQEPCTARSTTDTPLTVAAYIARAICHMLLYPDQIALMDNIRDQKQRFKWVKSFNALTWDNITMSPEMLRLQSKYAQLLSVPEQQQQQQQKWPYDFKTGDIAIFKGGLKLKIDKIDPLTDTVYCGDLTYAAQDVRGWSVPMSG